jgi:hypothetical protein
MPIDPRLLGGNFATEADLLANPSVLNARQAGIDQGFAGGDQWGQGRFTQFQSGLSNVPAPVTPAPVDTLVSTFEQPTIDYSQIPQVDYSRIGGLMSPLTTGQAGLTTGQAGLTQGQAGLTQGQAGLTQGQADLTTGQAGLTTGQTNILSGQQDITGNQQALSQNQAGLLGSQQGIQTGVTGLQGSVGQAATEQAPATGLYAGQSGLMAGQQQVGADIGRQVSGVGSDLTDFQKAMEAYQRGAESKRSEIQTAGVSGRKQLQRQVGDVGIQANRVAEQMAVSQQQATPLGAATAAVGAAPRGVQQQAAQIAQSAPPASQAAPMGPLGPVVADPRDVLIQQLFTAYQGLMTPQQQG